MVYKKQIYSSAFTIVELLVVIVIIGILAAITIVSYTGISQRAIAASLQSDLSNASQQLKLYYVDNSSYPTTNDCSTGPNPTPPKICLKFSANNSYTYQPNPTDYQNYSLIDSNSNGTNYRITDNSTPLQVDLVCPLNFIVVPGSNTYGTSDFCVMKYEAKRVGATTVPISQAAGLPWVNIAQTGAISATVYSPNVAGCTGCHLITEAEWLTIAQNVLSVPGNWSGGAVGSGYIYSGHNDNSPANALVADNNDNNGYANTGNYSGDLSTSNGMAGNTQRRTLALTNGEVIWDFASNVYEWTQGTIAGNLQPGLSGEVAYTGKQWNNSSLLQNGLSNNAMPSFTGLSGASGWSSSQGIGQLYSNHGETIAHAFLRGGCWFDGYYTGVLELYLVEVPGNTHSYVGFRVSR